MVKEINENEFEQNINEICIVDFFATWCPPCKMLAPVLERVSEEYKNKINFYKINTDENIELSKKYNITHVPTLIVFKNGSPVDKLTGFIDEEELVNMLEKQLV
jgi:thioredoxin